MRERLLADDLFLAKLAMECGVGVFTKTAAEYERRRENFFNELEVVFADVVYPDDIKAKFYFAKRKIIWEILDDIETGTQVDRLKRKIEIQWSDVLSFRATYISNDGTSILEVE
ncbi:hypothetical protein Bca52824_056648, partial [Brassica carinata]